MWAFLGGVPALRVSCPSFRPLLRQFGLAPLLVGRLARKMLAPLCGVDFRLCARAPVLPADSVGVVLVAAGCGVI